MENLHHVVRDAGYEALTLLAGFAAVAAHPTLHNAVRIGDWVEEHRGRRSRLNQLIERGLVESSESKAGEILRLTETGERILAGGRDPEAAWGRPWDGLWRLLLFDLPREARRTRSRFWRWLRNNHFGRLQGSVWVAPDPVDDLEDVMAKGDLDPSMVMVFTGDPGVTMPAGKLAAEAWNFGDINAAYRKYESFAERLARQVLRRLPPPKRLKQLLQEDRRQWWRAVNRDPLLPSAALPKGYLGKGAWKARQKLHRNLGKRLRLDGAT